METIAVLSYYHQERGPNIFYSYPESMLDEPLSLRITNIMDQTISEGFFIHSFEGKYLLNYYFEIDSDWARDNHEKLMISLILSQEISPEIEQGLLSLLKKFSKRLKANKKIFTAFYINDEEKYFGDLKYEVDRENILSQYFVWDKICENSSLVRLLVRSLCSAAREITRQKSIEDIVAVLLSKDYIFLTLMKVRKGPIKVEDLREWFINNFPKMSFKELIDILVENQLIIIKQDRIVETIIGFSPDVTDDRFPYAYVYKPPEPPDDIQPAFQAQRKTITQKEKPSEELTCPYCGYKIPKGQKYCPICGKDVF